MLKQAELRVNADYRRQRNESDGLGSNLPFAEEKGFNNVRIGTKISLFKGKGGLPKIGFIGNITLPVGNEEFRPPHAAPEGRFVFNNKISEKVEIQYNAGYRKRKEEEKYFGEAFYSASAILKLSEKLKYSVEFVGRKPKEASARNLLDTALQYKVLPNLQLDAIAGTGLTDAANDFFAGGGVTWRLPR